MTFFHEAYTQSLTLVRELDTTYGSISISRSIHFTLLKHYAYSFYNCMTYVYLPPIHNAYKFLARFQSLTQANSYKIHTFMSILIDYVAYFIVIA